MDVFKAPKVIPSALGVLSRAVFANLDVVNAHGLYGPSGVLQNSTHSSNGLCPLLTALGGQSRGRMQ